MPKNQATAIGLLAILLWSSVVALIHIVSQHFGAVGGAALMYSIATLILLFTGSLPPLRELPWRYLLLGGTLFVSYELCLSLSIGYAQNGRQAVEVGMVNYLWPTLTIIAAILFNGQKAKWWVAIGFVMSFFGIAWVLGGAQGLDIASIYANLQTNPLSYLLALLGAFIWAAYCVVTARVKGKKNAVTLFFLAVSLVLWGKYWWQDEATLHFSLAACGYALAAGAVIGLGYGAWNIGILHGNMTVLAGASYFIPILSALISAVMLNAPLSLPFWQGTALVCGGSLICWFAMRKA